MVDIILSLSLLVCVSIPIVGIVMHYRSQNRSSKGLTEEESKEIDDLLQVAENMADRIKTLEAILDTEYSDWRERHGKE